MTKLVIQISRDLVTICLGYNCLRNICRGYICPGSPNTGTTYRFLTKKCIFSGNKQKLALLCPYIVSNFYFCHRILLEVLARKVWDLIFSLLPKTCYCKAQFQFQSSRTEYSLNPDYFYPPPSTHPRDSSNEALLDYMER